MGSNIIKLQAKCCVVGGGPAGMVIAYLLARRGVNVVLLEKHSDFLRDFRGDTVHPSTLECIYEMGLDKEFLSRRHQKAHGIFAVINGERVQIADFSHLPVRHRFIAMMPQWDFLNFFAEQAKALPGFNLLMETAVVQLLSENDCVTGVVGSLHGQRVEVRADLVIGADGRHSTVRNLAKLEPKNLGSPIDVLWMRLSRKASDPSQPGGYFGNGTIFVTIDRGDYWQCAYVIPKGEQKLIQAQGIVLGDRLIDPLATKKRTPSS